MVVSHHFEDGICPPTPTYLQYMMSAGCIGNQLEEASSCLRVLDGAEGIKKERGICTRLRAAGSNSPLHRCKVNISNNCLSRSATNLGQWFSSELLGIRITEYIGSVGVRETKGTGGRVGGAWEGACVWLEAKA